MRVLSNDYFSNTLQTQGFSSGGPARFAFGLSEFLIKRGHEWIGLTNRVEEGGSCSIKKLLSSGAKKYFHASVNKSLFGLVMNARKAVNPEVVLEPMITNIEQLIRKQQPDIIFLNGYSLFSWTLLCAARNSGIPVVMLHAGIWQKEIEMYSDHFSAHGRRAAYEMEKQISEYAVKEVFLNESSWNYYNKYVVRVSKKRGVIIPLPSVPTSAAKKVASKLKEINIGIVARWDRIKNHHAVLALAEEIVKKQLPWKIHAVTQIPETKIQKKFKDRYKKLVSVFGNMNTDDLNSFISSMSLMILPSVFDVSPGVVLEAAHLGKLTIISPDVGFIREYREVGLQRAICSFEKPATVIARIKQLSDKSFASELKKLTASHKPEKIYKQYEKLLKDSVKNSRL